MDLTTILAIASLILSAASTIWIGGFKFSAVLHEVKNLGVRMDKLDDKIDKLEERMDRRFEKMEQRFEKLETRMDNFQLELHKHDMN